MSLLLLTGCTIGVKQKNSFTFFDPIPIPESARGVPRIVGNRPIALAIMGEDMAFESNVGGYAVITPQWYAALIDCWNKQH